MIKAVLFDLDGTLVDSREYIYQAFEHTLKEHGHQPVARSIIRRHIGQSLDSSYQSFTGSSQTETLMEAHSNFQAQNFHLVNTYPGITEAINELIHMGKKIAIITNRRHYIEESLEKAGINSNNFSLIIGAFDVANHKPHPEPINRALGQLKFRRNQAVMVGDGSADMAAAKAAGVTGIGVTYGFGYKTQLKSAGANYLIDSIAQLPDVLLQIDKRADA